MEEKRMAQLDPRLERVADFVRPGALFADVGCDHGHLSVELMRRGAQRGFACDIKEGPLQAAKRNLEKAGFADLCTIEGLPVIPLVRARPNRSRQH